MQNKVEKDISEEIIIKLKEIEQKIIQLLKIKNEKEFSDPYIYRNRA